MLEATGPNQVNLFVGVVRFVLDTSQGCFDALIVYAVVHNPQFRGDSVCLEVFAEVT